MKTTKEMIEVMQAYERGEQIEIFTKGLWEKNCNPLWDWAHFDYRVKPKKKYVPFETADEFLAAQRVNNTFVVKDKITFFVSINAENTIFLNSISGCLPMKRTDFKDLFTNYQFIDGILCGKEVIDE